MPAATSVKVRKVGSSYALTIPAGAVAALRLFDGQELEVSTTPRALEYRLLPLVAPEIDWGRYECTEADSSEARDGLTPEEYVRSLRKDDQQESLF